MDVSGGYDDVPLVSELYDHTIHYAQRPDREFYLGLTESLTGSLLELGCGTGRILLALAEAGHRVVGLDVAEQMLQRCRDKIANRPPEVQKRVALVHANMGDFDLEKKFELITTPFRSFHHLITVDEQLGCLRSANRHLDIGGRLCLDLFQVKADILFDLDQRRETTDFKDLDLGDGRTFTRSQRVAAFHPAEQYDDIELIHTVTWPDGRVERQVQAFPWRYFFRYEVEHLLHRTGFRPLDLFGDYHRAPLTDTSPEMIFLAEKVREAS